MASRWKQKVTGRFDASAGQYNRHNDVQARAARALCNALPHVSQARILEIGCGTGTFTQHVMNRYPESRFHITDISPRMLEEAKRANAESNTVEWSVMDGEKPDETHTYDLIVSNMAFQWFENPERALATLMKRLNPAGELFFTVPSSNSFKEWRSVLSELHLPSGFSRATVWPGIFKEEDIVIDYGTTLNFLRNIKNVGANVPDQNYQRLKASELKKACALNDQKHHGQITWHILYGRVTKKP